MSRLDSFVLLYFAFVAIWSCIEFLQHDAMQSTVLLQQVVCPSVRDGVRSLHTTSQMYSKSIMLWSYIPKTLG